MLAVSTDHPGVVLLRRLRGRRDRDLRSTLHDVAVRHDDAVLSDDEPGADAFPLLDIAERTRLEHIGRDVHVRNLRSEVLDCRQIFAGVVVAAHRGQHRVVAGLHRDVQVRAHLRLARQRLEQRVLDVNHLDA